VLISPQDHWLTCEREKRKKKEKKKRPIGGKIFFFFFFLCTDSVQFGLGRFGSVRFGADQTGSVRTLDRFGSDRFGSDTGPVRFGPVRCGPDRKFFVVFFFLREGRRDGDGEVERVGKTRGRCEFDIPEVKMEVVEVNRCGVGPRGGGGARAAGSEGGR
jgi:hypothetical protein